MGKIKAAIAGAAYRALPKSVKQKVDNTEAYKRSKRMEMHYYGAAAGSTSKGAWDDTALFMKAGREEKNNPARTKISPKKAERIDSSKRMNKETWESYQSGKEYYGNPNLSPKQFGK